MWNTVENTRAPHYYLSGNQAQLLDELNKKIASSNSKVQEKKKVKKHGYASQAKRLLKEINVQQSPEQAVEAENDRLKRKISKLKRKVADLEDELEKHRELDGYLRHARRLVKCLKKSDPPAKAADEICTLLAWAPGSAPVAPSQLPFTCGIEPHVSQSQEQLPCSSMTDATVSAQAERYRRLLYHKGSPEVDEQLLGSGVYVPIGAVQGAALATTVTSLARSLLGQIFDEHSLNNCSVKGPQPDGS